jgi:branched-subunit amino acid aminotransferase/4-amino-4-deoxychorismate lyase
MLVWLNGRFVDARRARVSALDRGLLHGDGVYDTWRTYGGRPFALAAHLRRLGAATRRLGLPSPGPLAAWDSRTRALLRRNGLADGAARLTITRGAAGAGPAPDREAPPTVLLTVRPIPADLPALQAHGVAVVLLPFARDAGPGWGAVKLVGHASAVVGKTIAVRRHAFEGLYVTPDGRVTEGTTTNLFAVLGRTLVTPPADGAILSGVTRELVLRIARREGLRLREAPLPATAVRRAGELFVTASTIEIVPVTRVDGRAVAGGRPGTVTQRLQDRYRTVVADALSRR